MNETKLDALERAVLEFDIFQTERKMIEAARVRRDWMPGKHPYIVDNARTAVRAAQITVYGPIITTAVPMSLPGQAFTLWIA